MKYLKSYKIFESSDNLREDIKDLLVDLEDQGFYVNVFKRRVDYSTTSEDILVSIYKEKRPDPNISLYTLGIFEYSDVEYYVNRLINFMKENNWILRGDLEDNIKLDTRYTVTRNTRSNYSQVIATSLTLDFKLNRKRK